MDGDPVRRRLFDRKAVAIALDVPIRSLQNLMDRGVLAQPVDAGGPRWTERDIEDCVRALEAERFAKKFGQKQRTDAHRKAKRTEGQDSA